MSNILRTLAEKVEPRHTALVIVDMQNDFCAQGGYLQRTRAESGRNPIRVDENASIADRIGVLADGARAAGAMVAWLRSVYDFRYLADAHVAMREGEGCCMEGTWGADFFRIQPGPEDVVVDKHTFSGFHETGLHAQLQARGIGTLVMTGVATNVCVDSTLRHGFFLGYHIVVAEDCVGSGNPVGHEGTLSTVKVNFGEVTTSKELLRLFGRHTPAGAPPVL
ncbi:cysteine hydrolase family protein [Pigmentiphaga kullae]|uniref:Ureidoacrylate peracid hydrolase n=1 Tax=Pigmentiphaga kullae TaxID=151784 RepID=A0A4V2F3W6_9BURK|nr:cysteine hydrolase [Pigmentiphaga kullae]RZS85537.1 ureidoacrylate peracid hydrolase [Pigmentiphaga kullae]